MPQEAEEEDKERDYRVIDAEVAEIAPHAGGRLAEAVRAGEGGRIEELAPGLSGGDHRSACFFRSGHELEARGGWRGRR